MTTAYIGTKIVAAWSQDKEGAPGYAVRYEDGYVSWSPKATFERCYRELTKAEVDLARNYLRQSAS